MVNLSTGDLKWLRAGTARSARRSETILGIAAVLYLCLGGFFLWLASRWAHLAGLTFREAWLGWWNGLSSDQDYSGVYLKTLKQFDGVAIALLFTATFVVLRIALQADHRRRARLLALIEADA
jgi:hypothetical protein